MAKDYTVAGKRKVELPFHISAATPDRAHFPVPSFKTHYANTRFGEPVDVTIDLPFVPVAEAVHARGPVHLDGNLDEWKAAKPYEVAISARLNKPLVLEKGAGFRFRVQVADGDNSDARHELSLTPGGVEADGIKVLLTE